MRKTKYLRIKGGAAAVAVANDRRGTKRSSNNELPEALKHTYGRGEHMADLSEGKRTSAVNFLTKEIKRHLRGINLELVPQKIGEIYDDPVRFQTITNILENIERRRNDVHLNELLGQLQAAYDA